MSGEASGEVWRHSPLTGSQLLVHLAIGDVVNDIHENEFWMSTESLAKKAKVSRSTVTDTLRWLVDNEFLELLQAGGATRKPSRYRFVFTSALAGGTSALTGRTSAPSAHERKELKEIPNSASAISGHADPACHRCQGEGEFYGGRSFTNAAGKTLPFKQKCSCVTDEAMA